MVFTFNIDIHARSFLLQIRDGGASATELPTFQLAETSADGTIKVLRTDAEFDEVYQLAMAYKEERFQRAVAESQAKASVTPLVRLANNDVYGVGAKLETLVSTYRRYQNHEILWEDC